MTSAKFPSWKPITLKPSDTYRTVANLNFTFDPAQVAKNSMKHFSGSIRVHVKTKLGEEKYEDLDIPWRGQMLDGQLEIDENDRRFICSEIRDSTGTVKVVQVKNTLAMPIILYQIKLENSQYFSVEDFDEPVVIQPLSKSTLFKLKFNGCEKTEIDGLIEFKCPDDINTESTMILHTNASVFHFNVNYHSGRLKYQTLSEDTRQLDFGLMGQDDNKCTQLMIQNFNPLDIMVKKSSTLDGLNVYPMSSLKISQASSMRDSYQFSHARVKDHDSETDEGFPVKLRRNTTMFFECCITRGKLGPFSSVLNFVTDHQILRIPVHGEFRRGSLRVKNSPIELTELPNVKDKSRIGAEVTVISSFHSVYNITDILAEYPGDIFFEGVVPKPAIVPNSEVVIGTLYYNISAQCPRTTFGCRGSLAEGYTKEGSEWQKVSNGANTARHDAEYYRQFRTKYEADIRRALLLLTNVGTTVEFEVKGKLKWPKLFLTERNELRFPDTVVLPPLPHGVPRPNTSQKPIVIRNPTDDYLQIAPLLMHDYRSSKEQTEIINSLKDDYPWLQKFDNKRVKYSPQFGVGTPANLNEKIKNWLIAPGEEKRIHLGFFPKDIREHETVLILRNNLTVLEPLRLYGRGIEEKLRLRDDSDQVEISILEDDLRDCLPDSKSPEKNSFRNGIENHIRIENHASIATKIVNMTINGQPCRGGGWEVVDCGGRQQITPFVIMASTTPNPQTGRGIKRDGNKKFALRYRPDFSMVRTEADLEVTTEMGNRFHFTLVAVLPPDYVGICRKAIPRPNWEAPCRRVILIMMIVLIFGFTFMGYIESNYLVEQWIAQSHEQHQNVVSRPRLKDEGYTLLGKMYSEYFKFQDNRALIRAAKNKATEKVVQKATKKSTRDRKGSNASSVKSVSKDKTAESIAILSGVNKRM